MLTDALVECARRRERLIARAERERTDVANALARWAKPLGAIERGIAIVRYLKAHPAMAVSVLAVALVLGRRSIVRGLGGGLVMWRTWRSVREWMRRLDA
jgi:hypothetical protein